ncbi:HAD family hydrolase [Streptomyces sp. NPDC001835]|uniref:HAD family hydrolase n=1 Tax=Streptomyces sp. NPDC001835 TaxID=3154528 RepID=UPI0033279580
MPVIFFDIGATLADVRTGPDGSLVLRPLPRVMAVLDALHEVRQGIISNPGPSEDDVRRVAAALHTAFPGRFSEGALLHWGVKDGRGIFDRAVASTGETAPDACVFVGEDAQERAFAREAGIRTAAHPVFALAATQNRAVLRARVALPDGRDLSELTTAMNETEAVVVQTVSERLALAMVTTEGAQALERAGFTVEPRGPVDATETFPSAQGRPVPQAPLANAPRPGR